MFLIDLKKKFLLIFTVFLCVPLLPQEISADLLNSVPQSIKDAFLNRAGDVGGDEDENSYNTPDTRITKLDEAVENLKRELSRLENQLILESGDDPDGLEHFGYNFFQSYQTSFSAISDPNPSSDYILDYGDQIEILLVGKVNSRSTVTVQRDGSVKVEKVGRINVSGLSINNAFELIRVKVSEALLGAEAFISLKSLRDMNILVIGDAENPGFYTLPGSANIVSLLHAVGGVKKNGSLRNIIHKRNNEIIQVIDLYEIIIKGNIRSKFSLRNGDVIDVQPAVKKVAISGGVNYPAIYEMKDGERFDDLVSYANGFQVNVSENIKLSKSNGELLTYSVNDLKNYSFLPGDSFHVYNYYPENIETFSVQISGGVNRPGSYTIDRGTKLSELILMAGGYTSDAYPVGGKLFRKKVAEMEREILDRGYRELVNYFAANSGGIGSFSLGESTLRMTMKEIKNFQPKGRLTAEFNLNKIDSNPRLDTVLQNGDKIEIPFYTTEVYIQGEVLNPGAITYIPDASPHDYLRLSGGLAKFAENDKVILIYPNGDAVLMPARYNILSNNRTIVPGTVIYAPREIGKIQGLSFAATLAPIISSVALSLASLNSIND